MSTKSEFIKAFNECARDSLLSNLMLRLGKKEETEITKELLEINDFEELSQTINLPFKTWRLKETPNFWIDEYTEDRDYLDDGEFGLVKKGTFLLRVANKKVVLKSVADLEDAMDLCGITKNMKLK